MELTDDDVVEILKLFEQSKFDFLQLEQGERRITVSKGGYQPTAAVGARAARASDALAAAAPPPARMSAPPAPKAAAPTPMTAPSAPLSALTATPLSEPTSAPMSVAEPPASPAAGGVPE